MANTLTVKAPKVTNKVVLWERHPSHPGGEIFVVADGKEYQVGKTQRVSTLIANGQLVAVEGAKSAAKSENKPESSSKAAAPWEGYDALSAEDVLAELDDADAETRAAVLAYEQGKGTRGRKTIIERLVGWNS